MAVVGLSDREMNLVTSAYRALSILARKGVVKAFCICAEDLVLYSYVARLDERLLLDLYDLDLRFTRRGAVEYASKRTESGVLHVVRMKEVEVRSVW